MRCSLSICASIVLLLVEYLIEVGCVQGPVVKDDIERSLSASTISLGKNPVQRPHDIQSYNDNSELQQSDDNGLVQKLYPRTRVRQTAYKTRVNPTRAQRKEWEEQTRQAWYEWPAYDRRRFGLRIQPWQLGLGRVPNRRKTTAPKMSAQKRLQPTGPGPESAPPSPPGLIWAPDNQYKVKELKDRRIRKDGRVEYKVAWEGWGPESDSWVPGGDVHSGLRKAYLAQRKIVRPKSSVRRKLDQPMPKVQQNTCTAGSQLKNGIPQPVVQKSTMESGQQPGEPSQIAGVNSAGRRKRKFPSRYSEFATGDLLEC
ncbi:hypothetical protein MMC10_009414 [Thelotrema lepadinum]|nr:hypothetical protein [Thelotrema lepadinum]